MTGFTWIGSSPQSRAHTFAGIAGPVLVIVTEVVGVGSAACTVDRVVGRAVPCGHSSAVFTRAHVLSRRWGTMMRFTRIGSSPQTRAHTYADVAGVALVTCETDFEVGFRISLILTIWF